MFDGATVSPPVISPNGDLVQDFAVIDYTVAVDTVAVDTTSVTECMAMPSRLSTVPTVATPRVQRCARRPELTRASDTAAECPASA